MYSVMRAPSRTQVAAHMLPRRVMAHGIMKDGHRKGVLSIVAHVYIPLTLLSAAYDDIASSWRSSCCGADRRTEASSAYS